MSHKELHYYLYVLFILLITKPVQSQTGIIDKTMVKQVVDGFGASTAWHGQISTAEADAAFKNENNSQLGLTILRVRIDPTKNWASEKANALLAKNRGAKVLATPWTPPDTMKTNGSLIHGSLKTSSYYSYALYLRSFYYYMQDVYYNKLVDVMSLQNEPDWDPDYEGCTWTAQQFLNFIKNYAYIIPGSLMMPESLNFNSALSEPTLNDSTAASKVTHIGGHLYGSSPKSYTNAISKRKKLWMTEHYYHGEGMDTCTIVAKEILDCFNNDMNAYIWWWLREGTSNIITSSGAIKNKGYAIAQFSKFVRPGYYRIGATYQPQSKVYMIAFKGKGVEVLVVVNQNTSKKIQSFQFNNDTVYAVNKYVTSNTRKLADLGLIKCTGNKFSDTLDAQSITTFVSKCVATPINPYLKVNNGILLDTSSVTINMGDSVSLEPLNVGGYGTWSWNGCGISGTLKNQVVYPTSSCNSIIVSFTNSCGLKTETTYNITVNASTSTSSVVDSPNTIKVFPNPANDIINLSDITGISKVEIKNTNGTLLMAISNPKSPEINISKLKGGIYFITVKAKDRERTYKFCKN